MSKQAKASGTTDNVSGRNLLYHEEHEDHEEKSLLDNNPVETTEEPAFRLN
jgi:hypothetical protein